MRYEVNTKVSWKLYLTITIILMLTNDRTPWLDLAVFGELGDNNAREYIRIKYGNETEQQAMKALEAKVAREQFDHDMRETEVGQNPWIIYRRH